MDWKVFASIAVTVFLAELGDKTQLATLLFASKSPDHKLLIFTAASLALVSSAAIAVLAGELLSKYVSASTLQTIAGIGFIIIGLWTLLGARGS